MIVLIGDILLQHYRQLNSLVFPSTTGRYSATGAIAGGVAAGAALLFAAPAIAFAWWRRRKPQEFFFDVPGSYFVLRSC